MCIYSHGTLTTCIQHTLYIHDSFVVSCRNLPLYISRRTSALSGFDTASSSHSEEGMKERWMGGGGGGGGGDEGRRGKEEGREGEDRRGEGGRGEGGGGGREKRGES